MCETIKQLQVLRRVHYKDAECTTLPIFPLDLMLLSNALTKLICRPSILETSDFVELLLLYREYQILHLSRSYT